jgi:hypothetical protein
MPKEIKGSTLRFLKILLRDWNFIWRGEGHFCPEVRKFQPSKMKLMKNPVLPPFDKIHLKEEWIITQPWITDSSLHQFVKISLQGLQEVILFFQNPADPKVQFDASTCHSARAS